jgi:hypothetical protein
MRCDELKSSERMLRDQLAAGEAAHKELVALHQQQTQQLAALPPPEQVAKAQAAEQQVMRLQSEVTDLTARIKGKELEIAQ